MFYPFNKLEMAELEDFLKSEEKYWRERTHLYLIYRRYGEAIVAANTIKTKTEFTV